jgi:hypothetical protein
MFEQVTGPIRGYYVAAYASPVGESGTEYVSYFKVFAARTHSYFEGAPCILKGAAEPVKASPADALNEALDCARQQVMNLPPASDLAATREQRTLYCWEACELGVAPMQ